MGLTGHLLKWAHLATPRLYDFLVPYVFDWGAFRSEYADQGPGNVFEPMPEWNQVTGGWRGGWGATLQRGALAGGAALAPLLAYRLIRHRG